MKRRAVPIALAVTLISLLFVGVVQATELGPTPVFDETGAGLAIAEAGVGLEDLSSVGLKSITIDIGGPVQSATLYWAGRHRPCDQEPPDSGTCVVPFEPFLDQELVFDGMPIVGEIVGTEVQESTLRPQLNIGYKADVTDKVVASYTTPGTYTFDIEDGNPDLNFTNHFDGAGLIVVFQDESDPGIYNVIIFDGLDFAFGLNPEPPASRVTEPVDFVHGSEAIDRTAEAIVFAGDGQEARPDRIDVSNNPSEVNELIGADGPAWDTYAFDVTIPANVDTTTLQLVSDPDESNPDSLLWITGAMRIPVPSEEVINARITGGGHQIRVDNVRITRGFTLHCDITLSNNLEINWPGGNDWHIDKFVDDALCSNNPAFEPDPPTAPADTYVGVDVGKLNGVEGSVACWIFEDHGEPGSEDMGLIQVFAVGDTPVVDLNADPRNNELPCTGATPVLLVPFDKLSGGNFQFHEDQPHK